MSANKNAVKPDGRTVNFHAVGEGYYYVQYEFEPDNACYVSSGIKLFRTYEDAVDWVRSQSRIAHAGISNIRVEVRQ